MKFKIYVVVEIDGVVWHKQYEREGNNEMDAEIKLLDRLEDVGFDVLAIEGNERIF